jgi:CBS domain-containing protein
MPTKEKKSQQTPETKPAVQSGFQYRDLIGIITIVVSAIIIIGLIVISCFIIFGNSALFTNVKELFAILLPVVGTWVGTVLAYYFSRENFEAASRSVNELVSKVTSPEDRFEELKVTDIMLQAKDFTSILVEDFKAYQATKIAELISLMAKTNSERIPFLEKDSKKFIFLIYRTTVERFLLGYQSGTIKLKDSATIDTKDLTIKNMFESDFPLAKEILNITGIFLPMTATLAEARKKMQETSLCNDVFITRTGNKDEAVEGWITDYIIIEKAELFKKPDTKK